MGFPLRIDVVDTRKGSPPATAVAGKIERMVRLRVRIRFSKQGDLRLIGHRDLMRCLERVFRRAGLTLEFQRGVPSQTTDDVPLGLGGGIEGVDEVMEVELAESYTAEELLRRLPPQCPPGLVIPLDRRPSRRRPEGPSPKRRPTRPPSPRRAGRRWASGSSICWPPHRGRSSVRTGAGRSICARSCWSLALDEGVLQMRLRVDRQGSVGPRDVLAALGLADLEQQGVHLRRTAVEVCA